MSRDYVWPDRSIYKPSFLHPQEWQRACINACTYCSPTRMQRPVISDGIRRTRARPANDIIAEIESMNLPPGSHIFVSSVNIASIPSEELREIFAFFKQNGLYFEAEATVAPFLDDLEKSGDGQSMLHFMSPMHGRGGCDSLHYGADDLTVQKVRGSSDKEIELLKQAVEAFRRFGIPLNISVVIGLKNHTYPNSFFEIAQAIQAINPSYTFIHIATPYRGTVWGDQVYREGRVFDENTSHYNQRRVVHRPEGMTAQELQQGYYWLNLQLNNLTEGVQAIRRNLRQPSYPFLAAMQIGLPWRVESWLSNLEIAAGGHIDDAMQRFLDQEYKAWKKTNQ